MEVMESELLTEKEIGEKILSAFSAPSSSMRSIHGIASDTGLPVEIVVEFIKKHTELFQESAIAPPTGSTTYTIIRK